MLTIQTNIQPSPVGGLGLFTQENIPAGKVVWQNYTDSELIIEPSHYQQLSDYMRGVFDHYGYLDKKSNQWKLPLDNSRFMNHSEAPNLHQDEQGNSVAAREIAAGEELTCNYLLFVEKLNWIN